MNSYGPWGDVQRRGRAIRARAGGLSGLWVLWVVGQLPRMPPWRRGVRNTHRRHYGSRTVERFAPKRRVMAENYLPAPIGARLRGLIATPIIAKGPATLGSAWKSHGKRLYHSFTVRKD